MKLWIMRGGRVRSTKRRARNALLSVKDKVLLGGAVFVFAVLTALLIMPTLFGSYNLNQMILAIIGSTIVFMMASTFLWSRDFRRRRRGQ